MIGLHYSKFSDEATCGVTMEIPNICDRTTTRTQSVSDERTVQTNVTCDNTAIRTCPISTEQTSQPSQSSNEMLTSTQSIVGGVAMDTQPTTVEIDKNPQLISGGAIETQPVSNMVDAESAVGSVMPMDTQSSPHTHIPDESTIGPSCSTKLSHNEAGAEPSSSQKTCQHTSTPGKLEFFNIYSFTTYSNIPVVV